VGIRSGTPLVLLLRSFKADIIDYEGAGLCNSDVKELLQMMLGRLPEVWKRKCNNRYTW
jgi:hypothetical protein